MPAGEMTGFLRLGEQDIFSPIIVRDGKAILPDRPGLGVEANEEKISRLARSSRAVGSL